MVVSPSDTNPYRLRSASWRHQRIGYRWILMQPGSGDPFTRASMLIATRENTHEHAAGPHDYPPLGVKGSQVQILSARLCKRPAQLAFYIWCREWLAGASTRYFARTCVRFEAVVDRVAPSWLLVWLRYGVVAV
jgi:hypothetical protein